MLRRPPPLTARRLVVLLLTLLFVPKRPVDARVYTPWVLSEHVADTSSLEAFRRHDAWREKQGQDLALAVWHYLVGTETGVFHYQPIREGPDPVDDEFRLIRDPIVMLNVYGYGFCGLLAYVVGRTGRS